MAVSTIDSSGLTNPLSATNLGTPSAINLSNATALPKAALPTGSVLQVVSVTLDNVTTITNSTSFVTTNFSASITPTSSTNKILITVNGGSFYASTAAGVQCFETIYRNNTTNLGNATFGLARFTTVGGSYALSPHSMAILDSPATTSSTTYTPYFRSTGGQVEFNNTDRGTVTMTLMEIVA
jgi:hypothetical protein